MSNALVVTQIVLSVVLILAVLLQNKGAGLSETFGGSGSVYATRRGPDKVLFYATVIVALGFFGISVAAMILA